MTKYIKHPISPCTKDCEERKVGCHSKCIKHYKYKKALAEWKRATKPYMRKYVKESDKE